MTVTADVEPLLACKDEVSMNTPIKLFFGYVKRTYIQMNPSLIPSPKTVLVFISGSKLMIGIGEAVRILELANGLIMLEWKSSSLMHLPANTSS